MLGYSIGQVVQHTGFTERQIRYCEKKKYIVPSRSPGGHRLFSENDLMQLTRLAEQRQKGMSLGKAIASITAQPAQPSQNKPDEMAVRLFFGLNSKAKRL